MGRQHRPLDLLPEHAYPVEPWRLVECEFRPDLLGRTETLFAVGNGFLGLRGTLEEGRPAHDHATLVAGFHETWPIEYAETAYGLATTGQTIVDVPDPTIVKLYVDDEPLFLPTAHLLSYERALDFRAGTLDRTLVWQTAAGIRVRVVTRRFVSLVQRHLAALSYEVTLLDGSAPVAVSSQLHDRQDSRPPDERPSIRDPRRSKAFGRRVLHNQFRSSTDRRILLGYRVADSGMTLGCGIDHVVDRNGGPELSAEVDQDSGDVTMIAQASPGHPLRFVKYAAFHTSRGVDPVELVDRAERVLARAVAPGSGGLDALLAAQRAALDEIWERADVVVDGDPRVQQALRWNLFQLIQASVRAEGTGIPAKGLTGHGYEGHYFWDIETYMHPFLVHALPRAARNLLRFRHGMLPDARRRAVELNERGALFPWRTINGQEASAYYQASTAQYHLNADVAHALQQYADVTGDPDVMAQIGVELLVETARLWADLGFYGDDDAFHLHSVTGPDEYTAVVNDNTFTNLMARQNLQNAAHAVLALRDDHPERYRALATDLALDPQEVAAWQRAADHLHIPFDERRGIHPQDAHFLEREVWDLDATPEDHFPLLLHYHPLVIYRHQVIKQADVLLAMFLLGDHFSDEQKRRNYDYYNPLTTGDSTLSPPVQSITAAVVGQHDDAMAHFLQALYADLADGAGNAADGVHVASAGGVWLALVYGFGGVGDGGGALSFDPRLPVGWSRLAFGLNVRGRRLHVSVTHAALTLRLAGDEGGGGELTVRVRDRPVVLPSDEDVVVALAPVPAASEKPEATAVISPSEIDVVAFDLDGVVTDTAAIHRDVWKQAFDDYLADREGADEPSRPFTADDYYRFVDGRPRYDGVRAFLESRAITLPEGEPSDPPARDTVCGVGNRKNALFGERLDAGVEPYPSSVALIRGLRAAGVRTALVSSSRNAAAVLKAAGIADLFDERVDGAVAAELGLPGKPAPDYFLEAVRRLGVDPDRAVVVEDATSGVEAGRRGGFRLVIGVNRGDEGQAGALLAAGADMVVDDLAQLAVAPPHPAEGAAPVIM